MGQLLPDAVFGCLSQVVPERVPAEGTSSLWNLLGTGMWEPDTGVGTTNRSRTTVGQSGDEADRRKLERYILMSFHSGGAGGPPAGGRTGGDGLPERGAQHASRGERDRLTARVLAQGVPGADSGGQGKYRGGLGQVIELENRQGRDFSISATYERTVYPARGRHGGGPGALGRLSLDDGTEVRSKGRSVISGDRRLIVEFPGGGGYGDPAERSPEAEARDLQLEFTSAGDAPAR